MGSPKTLLAEGEGFKPPIPERGIPDFESSAIDHSANLPKLTKMSVSSLFCGCKGNTFYGNDQNNCRKKVGDSTFLRIFAQ